MKKRIRFCAVFLAITVLFGSFAFSASAYLSSNPQYLCEQARFMNLFCGVHHHYIPSTPGSNFYVCSRCGQTSIGTSYFDEFGREIINPNLKPDLK